MKKYVRGFLLGVLCSVVTYAAASRVLFQPPEIPEEQRRVLIKEKFVPVVEIKERYIEIPKPYPVKGDVIRVPVTEYVEVEVPAEPVEVIRVETVTEPCTRDQVRLGGGCQIDVVGHGKEALARGLWNCTASGPGWVASRGPVLAEEVRFESDTRPVQRSLRRMLWAGVTATEHGFGPVVAHAWHGRKWGLLVQGQGVQVETESFVPSIESFVSSDDMEPVGVVMLGRRF